MDYHLVFLFGVAEDYDLADLDVVRLDVLDHQLGRPRHAIHDKMDALLRITALLQGLDHLPGPGQREHIRRGDEEARVKVVE